MERPRNDSVKITRTVLAHTRPGGEIRHIASNRVVISGAKYVRANGAQEEHRK